MPRVRPSDKDRTIKEGGAGKTLGNALAPREFRISPRSPSSTILILSSSLAAGSATLLSLGGRILHKIGMFARNVIVTGTVASMTSAAALIMLGPIEGRSIAQPLNATSHWLHGKKASRVESFDISHTGTGYATHHAATVFWASFFEGWMAIRPPSSVPHLIKDALIMGAVAAAVDYGATPKRFTPGWEFVLSKKSMATAYLALAAGLAVGAFINGAGRIKAGTAARTFDTAV